MKACTPKLFVTITLSGGVLATYKFWFPKFRLVVENERDCAFRCATPKTASNIERSHTLRADRGTASTGFFSNIKKKSTAARWGGPKWLDDYA